MSRNTYSEPRLYIGKREITNFSKITYKNGGANKVSSLSIVLTDPEMANFAFLGEEVVFYMNYGSTDTVPFFRGTVRQFNPTDKNIKIVAQDVLSYLAGAESPALVLTDESNFDGFTLSQMLHYYIETVVNKNGTRIGLDMLNDTNPPISLSGLRKNNITPLKIVQEKIPKNTSSLTDIKNYRLVVRDDGEKSNICFVEEQDIDSPAIKFSFNDGIEKLQYKRRPSPNYFTKEVDGKVMEYQHNSLPTGIHTGKLEGDFEYTDAAREEAFLQATLHEDKKEITITTSKGHYLEIGNIINIYTPEHPELIGKHRIVTKNVDCGGGKISCKFKLDKEGPEVSDYLQLG